MGCCSSNKQPNKDPTPSPPQPQPEQKQVQEPPKQQQANPVAVEWFVSQNNRMIIKDFQNFEIIGGQPKSNKYNGKVQVFEIQKKQGADVKDIQLDFTTSQQPGSTHQAVGAVKTIVIDNDKNKNQENAKNISTRLKNIKENTKGMENVAQFDFKITKNSLDCFFIDIFMPFAPYGTLDDEVEKRIREGKNYFTSAQIIDFMNNSLKVFSDLQSKQVLHTDIKPQNFLLINSSNIKEAKVADFRAIPDFLSVLPNQLSEHCEYTAPKLRDQQKESTTHNPYKSDLFSLGLTWLRVALLKDVRGINSEQDVAEQLEHLKQISLLQKYDPQIQEMISLALKFDEAQRPDFTNFKSQNNVRDSQVSNPTLFNFKKDQNLITQRLQKQQDQKQKDPVQVVTQQQNANYYLVGDEEEHLEVNNLDQNEQSNLELIQQQEALMYGGQSYGIQPASSQNKKEIIKAP